MQRYFVQEIKDNHFILNSDDSYHIMKVMRMKINDLIEVVYDYKCYICKITNISNPVQVMIIDEQDNHFVLSKVTIAQSLIKEQKMDYVIQKATELGVEKLIPLKVNRSIIKIDQNDHHKINRWQKIAKEASEQAKRLDIPLINYPMNMKELATLDYDYKLLCTVNEVTNSIKKVLSKANLSDRILVVVGPEGGFTTDEEQFLSNNGFINVTLGKLVLRSETVAINVLSIINYIFMR